MPIIVPHVNVCMSVLLGSNCCWARVTVDRCEFVCLLWLRSTEGHYAIPSNWDWYSMSVLFWRVTTTALKYMATDALAINKDTDIVRKRLISALESHWLKSYLKIRSHHFTALFRNCCFFFSLSFRMNVIVVIVSIEETLLVSVLCSIHISICVALCPLSLSLARFIQKPTNVLCCWLIMRKLFASSSHPSRERMRA